MDTHPEAEAVVLLSALLSITTTKVRGLSRIINIPNDSVHLSKLLVLPRLNHRNFLLSRVTFQCFTENSSIYVMKLEKLPI